MVGMFLVSFIGVVRHFSLRALLLGLNRMVQTLFCESGNQKGPSELSTEDVPTRKIILRIVEEIVGFDPPRKSSVDC